MKSWQEVKKEKIIHKGKAQDCISAMDTTIYRYKMKYCKGCKFFENNNKTCKKDRVVMQCIKNI